MRSNSSKPTQPPMMRSSPWTSPPERPARYRFRDRLADVWFGFLDGRNGIPELTDLPGGYRVRTPRINAIIREANQRIEDEWSYLVDDRVRLMQRLAEDQISLDTLGKQLQSTEGKLTEARHPLTDDELDRRRLAESDTQSRPAGFIRARRAAAWNRRRVQAEKTHQSVFSEWTRAHHHTELGRDLISEREAVARAAARRHREYALRRIATYLQQLVRSHPQGRRLNSLLDEYQVGPDLPEWTKET